jgi:hypothetical protein
LNITEIINPKNILTETRDQEIFLKFLPLNILFLVQGISMPSSVQIRLTVLELQIKKHNLSFTYTQVTAAAFVGEDEGHTQSEN